MTIGFGVMASPPSELRRDLRLADAVAVGLGAIVGAGLFVVTGVAAGVAGASFVLGLGLAGIVAAANALSAAQLAAAYPQSGGTYEYGYRLLGPRPGFAAGWLFLASKLAAGGTVALGFGAYLAALLPGVPPRGAALAAASVLTAANLVGIRKAGRLNVAIVAVTVTVLVGFVVAGLPVFRAHNLQPFAPAGGRGVLEAAALLFFAYTGYARVATLGEEVHDPRRTIPLAIVIALTGAAVLYLAVSVVAVGAVGAETLARAPSPLQAAAAVFPVPGMTTAVAVGAVTAMLGVLLSQVFAISRMFFAMGRRNDLPGGLAHVNRHGVPDRAVIASGLVIMAVAAFGTIEWIAAAASFTILVYYTITNLAALRLPAAEKGYPDAVAGAGLAGCVLLALSLRGPVIAAGIVLLAAGFVLRSTVRAARP